MLRWLVFSIAVPEMFPGALVTSDKLADAIMAESGGVDSLVNLNGLEETQFGLIVVLLLTAVMLVGSLVQIFSLATQVLLAPIAAGLTPFLQLCCFLMQAAKD